MRPQVSVKVSIGSHVLSSLSSATVKVPAAWARFAVAARGRTDIAVARRRLRYFAVSICLVPHCFFRLLFGCASVLREGFGQLLRIGRNEVGGRDAAVFDQR